MRLALLTFDFPPSVGGVQTILYELGRRLAQSHELTVVCPFLDDWLAAAGLSGVTPSSKTALSFWRVLRWLRPEYVIVGHAHPQLLLAAAASRRPYAALAYGNDYLAAQRRWHRPLFNALLGHADPFVTITRANADRLAGLGLPRPHVVYPGTDPQQFRPPPSPLPPPPRLLTVSRLVSRKGIDTVLATLPLLLPDYPDLSYIVAGEGPDRPRLEQLAAELEVEGAVRFTGLQSVEHLAALYRQAHIFVMPTREEAASASVEGFGIVYLEAAASGLPVVAGASGGAVEAVRHGVTGFLVPPDDPAELAVVLRRLLADAGLRQRLGAAGRHWVKTEMNWDRAAAQFAALLAERA